MMELPWIDQMHVLARIGREPAYTLQLALAGQGERRQARWSTLSSSVLPYSTPPGFATSCPACWAMTPGEMSRPPLACVAPGQPLFLERYLDQPIEQRLATRHGAAVPRETIVEVGNLAVGGRASARLLIVALTDLLVAQGFQWVVFTGTAMLLSSFTRLGLCPLPLGPADPQRMGAELADWGNYYAGQPQLMGGAILPGHQQLLRQGSTCAWPLPAVVQP